MSQQHPQIDVERRIAADPTSAVLMLAAPAAAEMWPGVAVASAEPGDHIRVQVTLPTEAAVAVGLPDPIMAVVRAEPPQRTPTAFVTRFSFSAPEVPTSMGTLTLTYAPADDGEISATNARLTFSVAADEYATPAFLTALERLTQTFLDNLAAAAEKRSRAA